MTWLTWRQFRVPAASVSAAVVVICAFLAVTGDDLVNRNDFSDMDVMYGGTAILLYVLPGVIGVFWGAAVMRDPAAHAANMADLFRFWSEGRIRPRVSRTFPLERAHEAIQALGDRTVMGKVVVTVED